MNLKSLLARDDHCNAPSADQAPIMLPLHRLSDQMFPHSRTRLPLLPQGTSVPVLDLVEKSGRIEVITKLPRLGREDVTIEVVDDIVVANDEKRQKEAGATPKVTDRVYGGVVHAVELPAGIRVEEIEAIMDEGVLPVRLPQPAARQPEPTRIANKAA